MYGAPLGLVQPDGPPATAGRTLAYSGVLLIPAEKLAKAAEAPSKLVQRARLVQKPNKLK